MKAKGTSILSAAVAAVAAFTGLADLERKDSSQFDYKYEMVALPTAEDLDGSDANDFAGFGSWLTLGTGANVGTISNETKIWRFEDTLRLRT